MPDPQRPPRYLQPFYKDLKRSLLDLFRIIRPQFRDSLDLRL